MPAHSATWAATAALVQALASGAAAAPRAAHLPVPACSDAPPPGVLTCKGATLWGNCSKPAFAGYCAETCGRCGASYDLVPSSMVTGELKERVWEAGREREERERGGAGGGADGTSLSPSISSYLTLSQPFFSLPLSFFLFHQSPTRPTSSPPS